MFDQIAVVSATVKVLGVLTVLTAATVWWRIRRRAGERAERAFEARFTRDADGIIVGAESIRLTGTRRGAIVLLHGYNDSPQALAGVAREMHARGWSVRVPLLPGHGRTLQAFAASHAEEWIAAARRELHEALAEHAEVAVGGLSMGGAIAVILAARHPKVKAIVGFAPFLHAAWPLRLLSLFSPIAALASRYMASGGQHSVHDRVAAASMISYGCSTPRLLAQLAYVLRLARRVLPDVRQPVLMMQSREDNRIPPSAAEEAFARLGSADKTLVWTTGAGHVITVDFGHEALERQAADWLESRLS